MKNSVKKSLNILQKLYMSGLIPYPRVSNNFELNPLFELFPHPPLPILNGINEPIKANELKVNKKSSLLTLSFLKLIQPSTVYRTSEKIDEYLDEELEFLSKEKEEELEKIIALFLELIEQENLQAEEITKIANSFYCEENKKIIEKSLKVYNIPSINFSKDKKNKNKNLYLFAKRKNKKETIYSQDINSVEFDKTYTSIEDFIKDTKQKNNILNLENTNESNINK